MVHWLCSSSSCYGTATTASSSSPPQRRRSAVVVALWVLLLLVFGTIFGYTAVRLSLVLSDPNVYRHNPSPAPQWILVGGVTAHSAEFRILLPPETEVHDDARLIVSEYADFSDHDDDDDQTMVIPLHNNTAASTLGVHSVTVRELLPETRYFYGIVRSDNDDSSKNTMIQLQGQFLTPAPPGTRYNFTVALSGCARTGSQHAVFDAIRDENPDLFVHMGDFHYEDITEPDLQRRVDAVSTVLHSPPQAALYRSTALAYMWDDHDYVANHGFTPDVDEENGEEIRNVALDSYRAAFPHYPFATARREQTPYQAFTVGTMRFLLTDARSEANATTGTVFGPAQQAWFQAELAEAAAYDFVIWINTKPWVGEPGADGNHDSWMAATEQRSELSDYIHQVLVDGDGPENLLMVSADAHMLAFDDGTNTYYGNNQHHNHNTTNQSQTIRSFPLLHSGPLDRIGSTKGGPYTEGCTAYRYQQNRQYSTVSFQAPSNNNRSEEEACLVINAYRMLDDDYLSLSTAVRKETVFTKRLCGKIFSPAAKGGSSQDDDDKRMDQHHYQQSFPAPAPAQSQGGLCEIELRSVTNTWFIWLCMTSGCIVCTLLMLLLSDCCCCAKEFNKGRRSSRRRRNEAFIVAGMSLIWIALALYLNPETDHFVPPAVLAAMIVSLVVMVAIVCYVLVDGRGTTCTRTSSASTADIFFDDQDKHSSTVHTIEFVDSESELDSTA